MAPSLISTTTFPGDDMSPEAIGSAASMLRFVGDQVAGDAADVVKTWSTISGSYDAPEAGQLVAAMNPVKTSGDTFDSHLGSAADALVAFADEVRTIKKTLEGIRAEANRLLATIDGNGKVGAGGIGPGSDWYHDPITFHHNEELIATVAAQAALLKAAEAKCGAAIASLVDGGARRGENGGPGFSTVSAPTVEDPPWGHVMTGQEMNEQWEREAPGWERGASKQVMEGVAGLATLAGFDTSTFDPSSGLPHGTLFGDWSVHNSVTTIEGIASMLFRHPLKTGAGALKGFFAIGDWDHPSYAIGEVAVNVAGVGLAFTKISSVTKIGSAGREAVDAAGAEKTASDVAEASRLAKLAEVGQRAGRTVVVPTVDGLKTLVRTVRLDTTWATTLDKLHVEIDHAEHGLDVSRSGLHADDGSGSRVHHPVPGAPQQALDRVPSHPVGDVGERQSSAASDASPGVDPGHAYSAAVFGESNLKYYEVDTPTLGSSGRPFFVMPSEDAGVIHDAGTAARYTGMSPSTLDAYLHGREVYAIVFPAGGIDHALPTAADAMGWPHYLEGGHTAVLLEGPKAGYLVNPTRELVIAGGTPVPRGTVLVRIGERAWEVMRRW